MYQIFHAFLICHIIAGSIALCAFWVPILGVKGGTAHRFWGRVFVGSLLVTGCSGLGMSLCSIIAPFETHPHIQDLHIVRGLLGWMMLYLATLTITLAWNGYVTARNRLQHVKNRSVLNVGLHFATLATAGFTAIYGVATREPLMIGISTIGLAAGVMNLKFIFNRAPARSAYVEQHMKSSVGAGTAVYTAFISVGLVRWVPQQAFNPLIWGLPVIIGVGLIVFHMRRLRQGWQWQAQLTALRLNPHGSPGLGGGDDPQQLQPEKGRKSGMDIAARPPRA